MDLNLNEIPQEISFLNDNKSEEDDIGRIEGEDSVESNYSSTEIKSKSSMEDVVEKRRSPILRKLNFKFKKKEIKKSPINVKTKENESLFNGGINSLEDFLFDFYFDHFKNVKVFYEFRPEPETFVLVSSGVTVQEFLKMVFSLSFASRWNQEAINEHVLFLKDDICLPSSDMMTLIRNSNCNEFHLKKKKF